MAFGHSILLAFLFLLEFCCSASINDKIVINNVVRTVDLTSQLTRVTLDITLQNTGASSVSNFILALNPEEADHLAFAGAAVKPKSEDDEKMKVEEVHIDGHKDLLFLQVDLPEPLKPHDSFSVEVEEVFSQRLKPFPAKIGQSDKQQVVYEGNHYLYSPYLVKKQSTTVKLASSAIESHSKLKPTSVSDSTISYGPYSDIKPFRQNQMKIHFENNSPFLSVVELNRVIEVSHWGNVAVEETFHVRHTGAELKGTFSRYDYQRTPTHATVKSFKMILPASAKDVYYRDEIGNISTSNLLSLEESVEVELRPRFPLFGGWQTRYYTGYNVPAYEYIFNRGDKYAMKMRFVDQIFDDFVINKLTVKIILPEGSKDIELQTPFHVKEGKRELHYTYLDTVGRPVVVIHKNNVVENHIQDFQVHYNFKKVMLLQEPLLIVGAFYLLFLLVIIMVRLDFSIAKDAAMESRMKAAGLVEELLSLVDRRGSLCSSYEAAIEKLKSTRDTAAFNGALKKANAEYNNLHVKVGQLQASLVKEDADLTEKLQELQKKENERKQLIEQAITLSQKVVSGKLGKQQYIDSDQINHNKRDKITEDIEMLTATL